MLEGLEFLSDRQKVLICQGAGVAVPGVYPFVFTDRGYQGQLDWLADTAAYKAPIADQAYTRLLAIAKEGTITLPQHITVELNSGQEVYLGPKLTTPKAGPLAKRTTLSMTLTEDDAIIQHLAQKEVVPDGTSMEEEGEEEEEEEEEEEKRQEKKTDGLEKVEDDENNTADLRKEEIEEKIQIQHEKEQEQKENMEDKRNRKAEEKQSRKESQCAFQEEDDKRAKIITVTFNREDISVADIKGHFQQYGTVTDVFLKTTENCFATVTFESGALAQLLVAMERQTLQRNKAHGGPVAMKLQGWAGRLPGGSGRGNPRRRAPVQQQNGTNPLRFIIVW